MDYNNIKSPMEFINESRTPDEVFRHNPNAEDNLPPHVHITSFPKVGRNDSCPCGSGKKFKKCCSDKEQTR